MKTPGPVPDVRLSRRAISLALPSHVARYFIGLHLCQRTSAIYGALVRVWGRGLASGGDVVARSCCREDRIARVMATLTAETSPRDSATSIQRQAALDLTELAGQAVGPLIDRLSADTTRLRTIGLLEFGQWQHDPFGQWAFVPCCDTALLARITGVTVVDDFPGRDVAQGGRGGPCEAVGAWLLMADRGVVPGRMIRGLVDVDETVRLFLLPPRDVGQLPPQLACYQIGPGLSLLDGIKRRLAPSDPTFDVKENLAVQGRQLPDLLQQWHQLLHDRPRVWSPLGADSAMLLDQLADTSSPYGRHLSDVLCSAIHLIAARVTTSVTQDLPLAFPIGQLVLGGPLRHHPFLMRQIRQSLPEVDVVAIDDVVAATDVWRAPAAALLSMLHVDQVPMNSPGLTGADTPRVLGRLTPGPPGNWHGVLSDLAETLPDKMTLRSAI